MVRVLPWTGLVGKLNTVGINLQDAYNVGVCGAHHMKSYLIKRMINVRREMLGLVEVCHYSRNDAVRKKKKHHITTPDQHSQNNIRSMCTGRMFMCNNLQGVPNVSIHKGN